jgi:sec-independent protein translocase protein TatA
MGDLGLPEILVIALIILVLFGSKRIPEAARGLGEGIRNFKAGMRGDDRREREDHRRDDAERRAEQLKPSES